MSFCRNFSQNMSYKAWRRRNSTQTFINKLLRGWPRKKPRVSLAMLKQLRMGKFYCCIWLFVAFLLSLCVMIQLWQWRRAGWKRKREEKEANWEHQKGKGIWPEVWWWWQWPAEIDPATEQGSSQLRNQSGTTASPESTFSSRSQEWSSQGTTWWKRATRSSAKRSSWSRSKRATS